jgi:hypothetical protein
MQELKPEGDAPLWAYSGIQAKCTEPVRVNTFGQNTASTMWIIPDTHRIVSVDLLKEIQVYLSSNRLSNQIRAIIEDKP